MKPENQDRQHHTAGEHGIHAVQYPAMARNKTAGILGAEAALDSGFKQITAMGDKTEKKREHKGRYDAEPASHHHKKIKDKHRGSRDAAADGARPGLAGRKTRRH